MDSIAMETIQEKPTTPVASSVPIDSTTATQPSIMTVDIKDENVALNIMVSFLNIAQKRGTFNLEESARIWQCVQKFIIPAPEQDVPDLVPGTPVQTLQS